MNPTWFTRKDRADIMAVRNAVSIGLAEATGKTITSFADDPSVDPVAIMFGIAQAHTDGLASALGTLEASTRDPLIDAVPEQLRTIIERGHG